MPARAPGGESALARAAHSRQSSSAQHARGQRRDWHSSSAGACARRASYHAGHHKRGRHGAAHRRKSSGCPQRRHHRKHHAAARRGRRHRSNTATSPSAARHIDAADVTQCPGAGLTPTAANLAQVREATFCLVNRERAAHGESPLALDPALQRSAQAHSESMAAGAYFEHVGPGGETPLDRMRAAGYLSPGESFEVGENIAWGTLWLGTPRAIVAGWMASPGHRENILDSHYRDSGVGVAAQVPPSWGRGQAGGIYTQDFGVRG